MTGNRHWITLYDEDGPYGEVCDCPIGDDHDVTEEDE